MLFFCPSLPIVYTFDEFDEQWVDDGFGFIVRAVAKARKWNYFVNGG